MVNYPPNSESQCDFRVLAKDFELVILDIKCNGHNLPIPNVNFPITVRLEKFDVKIIEKINTLNLHLIYNCNGPDQSALSIASVTKTTEISPHQADFILLGRTLGQTAKEKIQLLPTAMLDIEQEFNINEALGIELIKQLFWDNDRMQKISENSWVLIFKNRAISELHKKYLIFHYPLFFLEHLDHAYPTLIYYIKLGIPLIDVLNFYRQIPEGQKKYSEIIAVPATCPEIDYFLHKQAADLDPIAYCALLQILNNLDLGITLKNK